jgi:hypothetical protein
MEKDRVYSIRDSIEESGIRSGGTLVKYHDFEAKVRSVPMDENLREELLRISDTRQGWHVLRLLEVGRSEVENKFAIDFLTHAHHLYQEFRLELNQDDTASNIIYVINGDGPDTTMWWTVSPYLQQVLSEKGLPAGISLKKVFAWANVNRLDFLNSPSKIHLKGLEALNTEMKTHMFILHKNPKDISHNLACQLAEILSVSLPEFNFQS